MRRPTIDDVATEAGVSPQTVSRVANRSPLVSATTTARVESVMAQMGYRPNRAARALKSSRSRTLGMVTSDTQLYGPTSLLFGVEQAARAAGYYVSIASVSTISHQAVAQAVDHLQGQGVEGLAVLCSTTEPAAILGVDDVVVPTVLPWRPAGGGLPYVCADQETAAVSVTRHLLALGHASVRHVAGPPTDPSTRRRETGWRRALLEAGAAVMEPWVGDWSAASGYEAGRRIAQDPDVTAVFAANDQMALGVLRALAEAGRPVPGEVSVVGFDDIPEAEYLSPPLTSIRQDFRRMGSRYVGILHRQISQPGTSVRPALLPTELVVRASSAPPPARQEQSRRPARCGHQPTNPAYRPHTAPPAD